MYLHQNFISSEMNELGYSGSIHSHKYTCIYVYISIYLHYLEVHHSHLSQSTYWVNYLTCLTCHRVITHLTCNYPRLGL